VVKIGKQMMVRPSSSSEKNPIQIPSLPRLHFNQSRPSPPPLINPVAVSVAPEMP
jgi:hypothetical protein